MPDQITQDRRLVQRIDEHGVNLSDREQEMVESFLLRLGGALDAGQKRIWGPGRELSEAQRRVAEAIDERRVR